MNRFWVRQVSISRLHVSIVRNDSIKEYKGRGFLTRVKGLGIFSTLRVGTLYVNADLLIF